MNRLEELELDLSNQHNKIAELESKILYIKQRIKEEKEKNPGIFGSSGIFGVTAKGALQIILACKPIDTVLWLDKHSVMWSSKSYAVNGCQTIKLNDVRHRQVFEYIEKLLKEQEEENGDNGVTV